MKKKWLQNITVDDMPNADMRMVAELCGVEVAIELMRHLGGINIYIPRTAEKEFLKKYVVERYNGHNAKELAIDLGISVRKVFNILNEKTKPSEDQLGLFNENDRSKKWPD
jgi:Mor family transcriptional regulator